MCLGINAIELAQVALEEIQENFYKDFPECEEQNAYGFAVGSSMKPTQISCSEGGLNQIPAWCKISGDIRLVPFYDIGECMVRIEKYVANLNKHIRKLKTKGIFSRTWKVPFLRLQMEKRYLLGLQMEKLTLHFSR